MPIKIALVGAGHMGKIHIEKLASLDDAMITGVADVDPERARELAHNFKVPIF